MSGNLPSRRTVVERWERVGWDVRQETRQRLTGEGLPAMHPDGSPVTVDLTVLVLVLYGQDGRPELTAEVPLDDDTRRALAAKLSGGIVLAVTGAGALGDPRDPRLS